MLIVPVIGLDSPAAIQEGHCDRVFVDPAQWFFLDAVERRFVIEHELAHCRHGIESEDEADRIALEAISSQGLDPWQAYEAIAKTLGPGHPRASSIQQSIKAMPAYPFSDPTDYSAQTTPTTTDGGGSGATGNGNGNIDWTDIIKFGIETAGDVATDLFDPASSGGTPATPPPSQGLPMWAYLAIAAGVVMLGWYLLKK